METLTQMVKSIILIMMIAALLEAVMPRGDMKRYVSLLLGLFVVMALLNPIVALTKKNTSLDIFKTVKSEDDQTKKIIEKGQALAANQKKEALNDFQEKLSSQIAGLGALYGIKTNIGVKVDVITEPDHPDFGQIHKITLNLKNQNGKGTENNKQNLNNDGATISVEDITIDEVMQESSGTNQKKSQPATVNEERFKNAIADFYGLEREKVEIEH